MWGRKKAPDPPAERTWQDEPIIIGKMPTTYRELEENAQGIQAHDWLTPTERGLATSVLFLLDELKKERGT